MGGSWRQAAPDELRGQEVSGLFKGVWFLGCLWALGVYGCKRFQGFGAHKGLGYRDVWGFKG